MFRFGGFNHRLENSCLFPTFCNMKHQFWVGLGSRTVLVKKKFGADYEQLLWPFFFSFHGQKINLNFFENTVASALKICR